jgi:hypothetical protein
MVMQLRDAAVMHLVFGLMTVINRSYPGYFDVCWLNGFGIRRLQLSTSQCWHWSLRLCTRQHWCKCPELYLQLGLIRLCLLLPPGLLPKWAPRTTYWWVGS